MVPAGAVNVNPCPAPPAHNPFLLPVLLAIGVPSVQLNGRGSFVYDPSEFDPTNVYALNCALTPALRFMVPTASQCSQSRLPSVVRFAPVARLSPLPLRDPPVVPPEALFVRLKVAGADAPDTVAVTL